MFSQVMLIDHSPDALWHNLFFQVLSFVSRNGIIGWSVADFGGKQKMDFKCSMIDKTEEKTKSPLWLQPSTGCK